MIWIIGGIVIVSIMFTYALCKAASDADDQLLGDSQYYED
jgi:hypothetical protein